MAISIKNEQLSDSKIPGLTDLSVELRTSYDSAKVKISLESLVDTVTFCMTHSTIVILENDYQISSEFAPYKRSNICLEGSVAENVVAVEFNLKVRDIIRVDENNKNILMTVIHS